MDQNRPDNSRVGKSDLPVASITVGQNRPDNSRVGKSDLPVASITVGQNRPDSSRVGKRDLPVASITEGQNRPDSSWVRKSDLPVASITEGQKRPDSSRMAALSGISQRRRPWEGKRILVAECTLTNGQSMMERKRLMGNHDDGEAPHGLSCL
ncbi:unnamed protein product [Orchesella dallaii]|uniref:Mucin-like domain-containing protein n=1 Tax=Orchesella dallaii TaxID=48710 RepID=A0ABP1S0L2_9HEXA